MIGSGTYTSNKMEFFRLVNKGLVNVKPAFNHHTEIITQSVNDLIPAQIITYIAYKTLAFHRLFKIRMRGIYQKDFF